MPPIIETVEPIEDPETGLGSDPTEPAVRRGRRMGGVAAFDYLSATLPLAGTYRAVMGVLFENGRTFGISISTDQVYERLEASGVAHEARSVKHTDELLEILEGWGTVSRTQDGSLARSIEDLKRKRSLWRITEQGRIAEAAAREIEASFGAQGALRSIVLGEIERQIAGLAEFAARAELDAAAGRAIFTHFDTVFAQTKELADNALTFITKLDQFLTAPEISPETFVLAKDVIVGYVGGFLTDLRATAPAIAESIEAIDPGALERLLRAAAAADTPATLDADIDPLEAETNRLRDLWAGVSAWFLGSAGEEAHSRELELRAAEAITTLLRILARLNDARHRTISRARDFAALARWFEHAPDDATAHRIWHAAFGLASARHLRYPYPDEEAISPSASWWTQAPVAIEPRLRALGRYDNRGRSAPLEDKRAAQARIRAAARARAIVRARALDRFLDRGAQRFSELPELSDAEFDIAIECLVTALGTRREADGSYLSPSLDGRYLIRLVPPAPDLPLAVLRCPRGSLRGRDWSIALVSAGARSSRAEAVS